MSKKLKIQFWRAEKALAMQVLEQEGLPKKKKEGNILILGIPEFRDAYLYWAVNAIADELFAGEGELKVGEMCEVRGTEFDIWEKMKLIAILPEQYRERFIAEMKNCPTEHSSFRYARPIHKRTKPTVEECGNVITYTWEQ
jgi:hypothetical protein